MSLDEWIVRQNIEHYDRLLQTTCDERQRETLRRLKTEEEAKLTQIDPQSGSDAAHREQRPFKD